jgi:hypothetical protein
VVFGAVVAWLLGLRDRLLLAVAALPTGLANLALTAHVCGSLGISTSISANALVALLAAGAVGVARRWAHPRLPARPPGAADSRLPRTAWIGGSIGAAIGLGVWMSGIGAFGVPPQATDDIWHGYLAERLTHLARVTADTVAPLSAASDEPVVYYQYGLHMSAALVHEVTGLSNAEILNGVWVVFVGVLFPIGIAAAAWQLLPRRLPLVPIWAGGLAATVTTFPYLTNGILPYTAALAMIPGFIALLLAALDERHDAPAPVVALAALGIFLTHPTGAVAAAVLAVLAVAEWLARRSIPPLRAAKRLATIAVLTLVISLPWLVAAGGVGLAASSTTSAVANITSGVIMGFSLATPWTGPQPVLAILALGGITVGIATRRALAVVVALLGFGVVYVLVLAGVRGVSDLTGPWHADWHRLVAVVGMLVPLAAGLGAAAAAEWATRAVGPVSTWSLRRPAAIAVALVALVALGGLAYGTARNQSIIRTAWHSGGLLTEDDMSVLRAVAQEVGPSDKVLSSPVDGSTWIYSLYGATPVLPYSAGSMLHIPDLIGGRGIYVDQGEVCRTLQTLGATHTVTKAVHGDDPAGDYDVTRLVERYPELFTEMERGRSAVAYSIDADAVARCAGV